MKKIDRSYRRLFSVLFLACLIGTVMVVPRGQATQAQQARQGDPAPTQLKQQPGRPQSPVGSGFTYQGQLKDGGVAANGQYDLQFSLYDADTGGNQIGSTVQALNHTVIDGLFTVQLDFGASAFQGQGRWLEIAVQTAGGASYTTLTPRQPLTAAPYAASLMPGAAITGTVAGPALVVTNTSGIGLQGTSASGTGYGVYGLNTTTTGWGVLGLNNANSPAARGVVGISNLGYGVTGLSISGRGVVGTSTSGHGGYFSTNSTTGGYGVVGESNVTGGIGVFGSSPGSGVYGYSNSGDGTGVTGYSAGVANGKAVYGLADGSNGIGVHGYASVGSGAMGVKGESGPNGWGVYGRGSTGVFGSSTDYNAYGVGVEGESVGGGTGVFGHGGDIGVYGSTGGNEGEAGVMGRGFYGSGTYGVWGESENSRGVYGKGFIGVFGATNAPGQYAGYFSGHTHVTGNLSKGGGSFKIDHPLDPENKYLYHSFVESPDMMNIYNGNVTTDAKGEAVVHLPDWFETLNKDFRYQLTPIGQFAQAIVASEVKNNRFTLKTDKPNVKVSWQVTGIRKDAYASANRIPVEEDKPADEKGKYLHPKEHGQPERKGIDYEEQQQAPHKPPSPPETKPLGR